MRVLLVIDSLGSGGAQRQIVNLAIGLSRLGIPVCLFIYQPLFYFKDCLEGHGVDVIFIEKRSRFSISPIISIFKIIKNKSITHVVSFLETPSFYSEIVSLVLPRVRFVVSERSTYPIARMGIRRLLLQQMHRFAGWITVNSYHQKQRMVSKFPWMNEKISTIYNGYDLSGFDAAMSLTGPGHDYLAIASVSKNKNPMNLAIALKILREKYKFVACVKWVGVTTVSGEADLAFKETNAYLELHELHNQWEWLGERDDIPLLLAGSKALIHPSFIEGLPNVICEALCAGVPVLASNVCDHPLLVDEPNRGFLFDPSSPDSIASAIFKFESLSQEERRQISINAKLYAKQALSLDACVNKYLDVLRGIASENSCQIR